MALIDKRTQTKERLEAKKREANELAAQLKKLEDQKAELQVKVKANSVRIEAFKEMEVAYKRDQSEYETIRNSTITKEKYYEPDADFYQNELLNF